MKYLFSTLNKEGCISRTGLDVVECKNWMLYSTNLSLDQYKDKQVPLEEIEKR